LDSSKEEFARIASRLRRGGCATMRIDGPGQGEMLAHAGPTPRYEEILGAAVDALQKHDAVDHNRVGAIGLSLGGYYVPRAISFDRRVRAAVTVTGVYAFDGWEDLPPLLRQILTLRCGGEELAKQFAASVNLAPFANRIDQPLLVIGGGADPVVSPEQSRRLVHEAPSAELIELESGDHLGANRRWLWEARAVDWLLSHI
jgi:alpha-beta hydrolase superfamily lysophospholipase